MQKQKNKIGNSIPRMSSRGVDYFNRRFFLIEKYFSVKKYSGKNVKESFFKFNYAEYRLNRIRKRIIKKEAVILKDGFFSKKIKKGNLIISGLNFKRIIFRIEKIWFIFRESILHRAVAIVSLLAIIGGMYFQFLPSNVQGATYTWNQTTWAGGEDGETYPDHTDNRTNWTKYSSKDSGISAGTELSLAAQEGSSSIDFNTEENYTQEDATNGTDFSDGKVSLHITSGAVATGGTVSYSGGYKIHTFTSSGTFAVTTGGDVEYLVVAGGGGGAQGTSSYSGGGGGAGGVLTGSLSITAGNKTVTVGNGGLYSTTANGSNGGNSVFDSITATGGGGGGRDVVGSNGGSGGGGASYRAGGTGVSGQGNNGGVGYSGSGGGGGGGGAGAVGSNGTSTYGGAGGIGVESSISGTATYYGGGAGGASPYARQTASPGGLGGGGNGGYASQNATAGTANTGGGGGGAGINSMPASGGSGIVIARYLSGDSITSQPYYVTTTDSSQINTSTYAHITGATLTQTTPANTDIKYLVSFDDRSTWKYWDGDSWETSSLDNLQTNGMSKATIEGLSQSNWESTGGFTPGTTQTIDLAADLSTSDSAATPDIDNITFNYSYYSVVSTGASNIDFATEGDYTQENSSVGTDFSDGKATLSATSNGYDSNTKLLMHMNDASLSDETGHSYSLNGNIARNSSQSKFGGYSAYCDGTDDFITVNDSVDWTFGTGDFTVDFWANANSIGAHQGFFGSNGGSNDNNALSLFWHYSDQDLRLDRYNTYIGFDDPTLTGSAWHHYAIVKSSGVFNVYRDGVLKGTKSGWTESIDYAGWKIGTIYSGSLDFAGYIDEFRVSNVARWTSDFTPPSSAYTSGSSYPTSQPYYVTTTDSSQINTSTYAHITGATLTQTTPANTDIKYLVSFDDRSTWKYWDGDSWESSSLDNLQTNGMSEATIEAITESQWESTGGFVSGSGTLDFAADLSTSDSAATPDIDNIAVNYEELPNVLVSSAFDTEISETVISKIAWSENLPEGTDAKFQIQTAPDNSGVPGTWTGWQGPTGSSSYFTDSAGNETLPSALSDGVDDQWIQYRIFLETDDTSFTPTVSYVDFTYAVNAAPEIQNVTASQGTDGIVTVNYETRDIDTDTGVTQNQLNIILQYCTANCSSSGSETWTDATTVEGDGIVSGISQESWASKSLTWTAKTDYDNQYNNTDFKIRIKADDSEGANRYGYGSSAAFTLDTTDPTPGAHPILIDASTSPAAITLSASDDSSLKMKVGLNADLSDVAEWSDYSSSDELALASDPDTVYVQFKDVYGNTSSIQSATTPETPTGFMSQDTSNLKISPAEYRLFIAWKMVENPTPGFASYKVYRSESSSGPWTSLVRTEADRTVNSYGDNSVVYDTHYYYKVKVTDQDGNVSFLSETVDGNANGIQDEGEGGGGTETTAPTISNVEISNINTTQATVTWNTNELSNSTVGYSTTQGVFTSETGVATMLDDASGSGQHRVVLSGLTPNNTYYLQVESEDSSDNTGTDNNGGNGYSFATLSGPVISGVYISNIEGDRATIHWTTNSNSNSYVTYSINSDMTSSTEVGTSDSVTSHSVQLTGLTSGQKYYFFVESGISSDNNEENYYSFITSTDPADTTDPVISSVSSSSISDTDAVIKWSTDEGSTSKVYYGTVSGSLTSYSALNTNLNFDHAVTLPSLDPDTTYYYRVVSVDEKNNEATSAEYSFETEETIGESVTEITDISDPPSVLSNNKAVITFKTDNQAQCIIEYGTASETYGELPVSETSYNVDHSMHIVSLISSSKYYYQITCTDPYDNVVSSDEGDFTTTSESTIDEDSTAPEISGVSSGTITGESVTITWDTDEETNSLVRYGITSGELTNIAGDGLIATTDDYDTDHTVVINNLTPGTKYYYTVFSYDAAGNIGESSEDSFTTKSPSSLSSIKVVSTSLGEAIVTWTTSSKMSSVVEYGETEEYGDKKESSSLSTEHEVSISGLKSGTPYHFRVKGEDDDNNLYSSGDYTFEPKSPPKISSSSVDSVTEHGAKMVVVTDIPTDILVTYADTKDSSNTGSQGKPDFVTRHELELGNLDSGTTYSYVIKITDEQGNQTTSEEKTFTTGRDENPPEIIQVKTDSALAQNDKVQSIISWSTNELATTSFIYKEGLSGEEKEIVVSEAYSQNHIVVSTIFKTGTVYHFKVKSVDRSGNETVSSDFALLTPKKKENIVQIIVTNFQDIFGWAGVIGK